MKQQDYLRDPHVAAFLAWMGHELQADARRPHGYSRPGSPPLEFAKLGAAFDQYDWDFSFLRIDGRRCSGRSFAENAAVLGELQGRLRQAVAAEDDAAACDAAVEVVRWGGVAPRNEEWLRANGAGLAKLLARVRTALESDEHLFERGKAKLRLGADLRFNAGMTKVYSLLLDHFVIYDSRVAGALAWFVAAWARRQGLPSIPASLKFPCMPAKEAPGAARRKLRTPWIGADGFPDLRNRPYLHAEWNRYASWIIRALLEAHPCTVFGTGSEGSRRMEAALFMWGYDLTPPQPQLLAA
jgi:hypothetical protein